MWPNRKLASVSVRGDDPNMRPGEIFAPQPLRRVAKRVDSFYWGSGLCDDVPALAWYLVGACVPLTLGIAALAALVLGDGARAEQVATRLASVLPPGARDQVIDLVLRTHRNSPLLLAVAVASMLWAGAGATGVVERVESRLLGAPRLGPIALKLRHLGLAAGMVLMIALMAAAATEATNLRGRLGFPIPGWLLSVLSAMLIAAICSLLYRYATTRRISWRAAVRGGVPAAVVLELTPLVAGYYARAVAGRTPVQVFLVLAGLLFTCYLVAQGLVIGAGLAAGRELSEERTTERVAMIMGGG
ncbi:MAG TPA: YhjD/YihY/BrkB family envelope integrity protein [Solirubrobacteraceae bacterium]|nr:YhjD/YihY/BrkB family envelope integrity protein [Solirubrobacteraceae bacterium]